MGKATLKDIADKCSVSTATVSMVLAGKGSISPEVTDLIKKTAEKLEYVPRTSRKQGKPGFRNVCILQWEDAPFLWQFSQPFVLQFESIIVEEGYRPIIIHCLPQLDNKTLFNEIKSAHAGAVFSINYANPDLFDQLEDNGIPLIIINNNDYQDRFWSVLADDIQGAYDGTQHLIEQGHTRIAFADYVRGNAAVVRERQSGFRLAMQNGNIRIPDNYFISGNLDQPDELKEKIRLLMNQESPPTAIFVHDDYYATIIYAILSELGYNIPNDISLISPGDVLDYRQPFYPRLTTMQIDRKMIVRMAWDLLMSRIDSSSGKIRVIKTRLHLTERGSCAPPE